MGGHENLLEKLLDKNISTFKPRTLYIV